MPKYEELGYELIDIKEFNEDVLRSYVELYNKGIVPHDPHASPSEEEGKDVRLFQYEEEGGQGVIILPKENDYTHFDDEVWRGDKRIGQIYGDHARDKWFEEEGFIASILGVAMCSYSLWTYPQLCNKYGGFTFCLMSLITTCVVTLPMIYLELLLGQFCQDSGLVCWKLAPIFKGLAFTMIWNTLFNIAINNARLAWLTIYSFESFHWEYPWANCTVGEWTTVNCRDFDVDKKNLYLDEKSKSPAYEYFRGRILRVWKSDFAENWLHKKFLRSWPRDERFKYIPYDNLSSSKSHNGVEKYSIDELGPLPLDLVLIVFIFYFIMYYFHQHRVRVLGHFHFYILMIGTFLLMTPLIYTWLLPHSRKAMFNFLNLSNGVEYWIKSEAWVAAFEHSIISGGFGTGLYIVIGSHNKYVYRRVKRGAFFAGIGSWFIHCIIAWIIAVHSFMVVSHQNTGGFAKTYFGEDPITGIFPLTMASKEIEHKISWYFKASFFGALVFLSMIRTSLAIYYLKRLMMDAYKHLFDSVRLFYDRDEEGRFHRLDRFRFIFNDLTSSRRLLQIILILTGLFTLIHLHFGGVYLVLFLEGYSIRISHYFTFFLEIFAFTILWGTRNIDIIVTSMTFVQSTLFNRLAWRYFCPMAFMLFFLHHDDIIPDPVNLDGIQISQTAHEIGLAFGIFPLIFFLFFFGFMETMRVPVRRWRDKMKLVIAPRYEWSILTTGEFRSNRTWWVHYLVFPSGFCEGDLYLCPKMPQESRTCLDCGKRIRNFLKKYLSFGFFKMNVLCLSYQPPNRPPTPGQTLPLPRAKAIKETKLERRPNLKLLREQERLKQQRDPLKEEQKYLIIQLDDDEDEDEKEFVSATLPVKSGFSKPANQPDTSHRYSGDLPPKSRSNPSIGTAEVNVPDRAEAIRTSLKDSEVRKSFNLEGGIFGAEDEKDQIEKKNKKSKEIVEEIIHDDEPPEKDDEGEEETESTQGGTEEVRNLEDDDNPGGNKKQMIDFMSKAVGNAIAMISVDEPGKDIETEERKSNVPEEKK